MTNDPDLLDVWVECHVCEGSGIITEGQFDFDCPRCDGDGGWER